MVGAGGGGAAVLCVGAVTLDTILLVDRMPGDDERVAADRAVTACGGPAATAAVTLARLGVSAVLAATIGTDAQGTAVMQALESAGVGTGLLTRDRDVATAASIILLEAGSASRRIITIQPGGPPATALASAGRESEWVHVDHAGWWPVRSLRSRPGRGRPWRLSVDGGNPIPGLDLAGVDLYAPTLRMLHMRHPGPSDEAAVLSALHAGASAVAATDGPRGALTAGSLSGSASRAEAGLARAGGGDAAVVRVPGFPIEPVSTLGAGDVFHGGLLAGLVHGLDLVGAVRMANATAALSCRALDGQSGIPRLPEVEALLAQQGA
jgi:sulfofructose kinase